MTLFLDFSTPDIIYLVLKVLNPAFTFHDATTMVTDYTAESERYLGTYTLHSPLTSFCLFHPRLVQPNSRQVQDSHFSLPAPLIRRASPTSNTPGLPLCPIHTQHAHHRHHHTLPNSAPFWGGRWAVSRVIYLMEVGVTHVFTKTV